MNQQHGNPNEPPGACRQIHERMVWKPAVLRTQISWAKRTRKSKRFEVDWKMEYLVPWYHLKRCSKPHFPILSPLEWKFYGVIPLCIQTHPEDHKYPFHLSAMLMIGGWIIFHSLAKQFFFWTKTRSKNQRVTMLGAGSSKNAEDVHESESWLPEANNETMADAILSLLSWWHYSS